ncbi:UNVERIFIED_ORG: phosphoserine phosphatase [Agrobacterium larrymoorei]|uniref:hypothetical protein n=1 Tax=Agrobacterium cavarae TaxID=2528239 RepID=UPI00196ABE15|nr:hypothetical protein [Agrobacterium cavarae]MDP9573770.1 phosphoserine phosphatase [Agrobacterium larrymoorei]
MSPATAARHTAFAFDLDGTSTRAELLPVKAPELGLEAEMRLLTSLTMAEKNSFKDSFIASARSGGHNVNPQLCL